MWYFHSGWVLLVPRHEIPNYRQVSVSPPSSPDLEVLEALGVHLVQQEVWQLLTQLMEAEEETLHVTELQFGLLVGRVLAVLRLLGGEGHELLHHNYTTDQSNELH